MEDESGAGARRDGVGDIGTASPEAQVTGGAPAGGQSGAASGGGGSANSNPTGEEHGEGNIGRTPVSDPASQG
jgi:hypothetical protein